MTGTWLAIAAFACVVGGGTLWFRKAYTVELPENRTGFGIVMGVGAALGVAAFSSGVGWLGGIAATVAMLGGGLFLLLIAISAQKGGSGSFQLGEPVPKFSAPDHNGETFDLQTLDGKPLLLKFFRGHW